jgi:uncharacterized protein
MSKRISKQRVDWPSYLNLVEQLYNKINWKREKFQSIVAINRGGNIIGTILSHKTNLPLIILNKAGMIYEDKKFLVVDDIADTGSTLDNVYYLSQGKSKDFKTAVLHRKPTTKVEPNYFVETTERWIVYPYERA